MLPCRPSWPTKTDQRAWRARSGGRVFSLQLKPCILNTSSCNSLVTSRSNRSFGGKSFLVCLVVCFLIYMFNRVHFRLHGQTPQHQLSELIDVSPYREAKPQRVSGHLVATRKEKVLQNIIPIFFPEASEGRRIKTSLMTEICQLMQHFTGNTTSPSLLSETLFFSPDPLNCN